MRTVSSPIIHILSDHVTVYVYHSLACCMWQKPHSYKPFGSKDDYSMRKMRNERGQPYHAMILQNLLKDPHYIVFEVCKKSGISQWVLPHHIIACTTLADINA